MNYFFNDLKLHKYLHKFMICFNKWNESITDASKNKPEKNLSKDLDVENMVK